MTDPWFKPKTHGGAAPTNWKGWTVTLVYALAMIAFSVWMVSAPGGRPDVGTVLAWVLMVAAVTSAFCLFVKSKTDGDWKWRWGGKE